MFKERILQRAEEYLSKEGINLSFKDDQIWVARPLPSEFDSGGAMAILKFISSSSATMKDNKMAVRIDNAPMWVDELHNAIKDGEIVLELASFEGFYLARGMVTRHPYGIDINFDKVVVDYRGTLNFLIEAEVYTTNVFVRVFRPVSFPYASISNGFMVKKYYRYDEDANIVDGDGRKLTIKEYTRVMSPE